MAKKKIKKGSVYIQTNKGLHPIALLDKAELKRPTNQSKQLKQSANWMRENDLVPMPFPPEMLLTLYESNPVLFRCVNQQAIDVAGLGWSLHLKENKKEDKIEFDRLTDFIQRPNPEETLRFILKQLLIDLGAIGWFGLEVVRNNKGEVAELYHVPAHTLRVHTSKEKYCQQRGNKKVWFKNFGSEKDISEKDGKQKKVTAENKANELIFYKNYYPKSDFYGAPSSIAAVGDVMGLIGLRDFNLAFFENYGMPSALIVLEGEWDDNSEKIVAEFVNREVRGTDNAHRTLVVTQPDNCKFSYTPLSTDIKEGSFKLYETARREDILVAFAMPPERIGIRIVGKLGGNVAEEATRIYVQSVVEPLQLDLEDIINDLLLQSETYLFKFANIDLRDYDLEIQQMNTQVERGILTPNEARNKLGLKPYAEGDKYFILSSLIEIGAPDEPMNKAEKELYDENE